MPVIITALHSNSRPSSQHATSAICSALEQERRRRAKPAMVALRAALFLADWRSACIFAANWLVTSATRKREATVATSCGLDMRSV